MHSFHSSFMWFIFNLKRRKICTILIQYVQFTIWMKGSFHAKSLFGVIAFDVWMLISVCSGPMVQANCIVLNGWPHPSPILPPWTHPLDRTPLLSHRNMTHNFHRQAKTTSAHRNCSWSNTDIFEISSDLNGPTRFFDIVIYHQTTLVMKSVLEVISNS